MAVTFLEEMNQFESTVIFLAAISLLIFLYSSIWREVRARTAQRQGLEEARYRAEREQHRAERQLELDAERLLLEKERMRTERQESESRRAPATGPGSGGYILIDMPDDNKALFHDVLKGFEEYGALNGYEIRFSIDGDIPNKIAFRFTVGGAGVIVSPARVEQDLGAYLDFVAGRRKLSDLEAVIPKEKHDQVVRDLEARIAFLRGKIAVFEGGLVGYEKAATAIAEGAAGSVRRPQTNNFYLTGVENMGDTYKAENSPHATVGKDIVAIQVNVGNTPREKADNAKATRELLDLVVSSVEVDQEAKDGAVKYLGKVQDELDEARDPSAKHIQGWLERAKQYLVMFDSAGEVIDKAKEVFGRFELPF